MTLLLLFVFELITMAWLCSFVLVLSTLAPPANGFSQPSSAFHSLVTPSRIAHHHRAASSSLPAAISPSEYGNNNPIPSSSANTAMADIGSNSQQIDDDVRLARSLVHLNWQVKHYRDLTLNEFHDIIALRLEVFVVEQDCPYLDLDGKDKKCYHLICKDGKEGNNVMSTSRILPPGVSYEHAAIGRVVVDKEYRGRGIGHEMMDRCIDFCQKEFGNDSPVIISAQKHLEEYYRKHQFVSIGSEYLDDGIPHIEMKRSPQS